MPIGVYDDPPPSDVPALRGKRVGRSGAAKMGRLLTKAADFASDVMDDIPIVG